jgi:hypothetical protein
MKATREEMDDDEMHVTDTAGTAKVACVCVEAAAYRSKVAAAPITAVCVQRVESTLRACDCVFLYSFALW